MYVQDALRNATSVAVNFAFDARLAFVIYMNTIAE